jgi:hypothetical protein
VLEDALRKAPDISAELLRSLLHYEPDTGVFTWKRRPDARAAWNTRYAGKVAGFDWLVCPGLLYRSIRIFDWPFLGHRLAWIYMTGEWPAMIDHRDSDGLNNRWENLRPATKAQNAANTGICKTNTTGFKGVSPCKSGKFRATIRRDGRQVWLGRYATAEEASIAYRRAAAARHGEYERFE